MLELRNQAILAGLLAVALTACGETGDVATHANSDQTVVRLASYRLRDGREVVLRAHEARGSGAGPCLAILGIDRYTRQCGRAPSERVPSLAGKPIHTEATAQIGRDGPLEVYGATSADVASVLITFHVDGSNRGVDATLLRVTDRETLDRAGIAVPFGYFFAELPTSAAKIRATALDGARAEIGAVSFGSADGLHPHAFIAERIQE